MDTTDKNGWTPLPHSDEDLKRARQVPDTPQTRAQTYRLAWDDEEFMTRRELRAVRLQLELLKPEMARTAPKPRRSQRRRRNRHQKGRPKRK